MPVKLTTRSVKQFTGDHADMEYWASYRIYNWLRRFPEEAVFGGSQGVLWLVPERLERIGLPIATEDTYGALPGEWIVFDRGQFTAHTTRPDQPSPAPEETPMPIDDGLFHRPCSALEPGHRHCRHGHTEDCPNPGECELIENLPEED